VEPKPEDLKRRLEALRAYRWSSWAAYAGYAGRPEWLTVGELTRRAGGQAAYRTYVQEHVTRGVDPEGYEAWPGRVALGTPAFLEQVKRWVGPVTKEQPGRRELRRTVPVAEIVRVVERERQESWREFAERHGDWGRDLVLYLARQRSGLTLGALGAALGLPEYKTVGKAVQRFEASLRRDRERRRVASRCLRQLSIVET
jgi:hypothetical protein